MADDLDQVLDSLFEAGRRLGRAEAEAERLQGELAVATIKRDAVLAALKQFEREN